MTSSCWAAAARGRASVSPRSAASRKTMRRDITSASGRRSTVGHEAHGRAVVRSSSQLLALRAGASLLRTTSRQQLLVSGRRTGPPCRQDDDTNPTVHTPTCSSALRDLLQLELVQHRVRIRVARGEGLGELVLLLCLQL